MDQSERIRSLYETTLKPRIEALEHLRLNLRTLIVKAGALLALPLAGILFGDLFSGLVPDYSFLIPWISFALLLVALMIAFRLYFMPAFTASANYKTRFKREVLSEVFSVICPTATYLPFESIPETVFDEPGIFHRGGYWSDDLVRGRIGETPFEAAEVWRTYSTGTGKSRRTHTVFRGLFFHVDFNRVVRGTTIVDPVSAKAYQAADRSQMQRVAVGEQPFAAAFKVYATDPAEAHEILTPALLDRLLSLQQHTDRPIFVGLKSNRLYLGVHYDQALFEPGIASTTSLESIQTMA